MRMIVVVTALIGLSALAAEAAGPPSSDHFSQFTPQPSDATAKTQDQKKAEDTKTDEARKSDTTKTPDDGEPTAAQPNVMPQDRDKQPMQPAPGQEPSPNPGRPHS